MNRRRLTPEHAFEGINATPLIDVVMCLIIFFLVVGKLVTDRESLVKLPQTRVGETTKSLESFEVNVIDAASAGDHWLAARGQVFIAGERVQDATALEQSLREHFSRHPKSTVEVRADRDLPYNAIEPVLRACRRAGGSSIRLATEKNP